MRIAIPVKGSAVFSSLGACEAFHFYEDDHGKIVKQYLVAMEGSGVEAAVALLERYGIDALICGTLSDEEMRAVMLSGIMFFAGYAGDADQAALNYLSGAIAFDPNNTCNACGHGHSCSMNCSACTIKHE